MDSKFKNVLNSERMNIHVSLAHSDSATRTFFCSLEKNSKIFLQVGSVEGVYYSMDL